MKNKTVQKFEQNIRMIILGLSIIFFLGVGAVGAHLSGYNSVDDNEIRWGGSTQYTSAWNHGIRQWNGLNPVDILPDTSETWQDLTVSDVNDSSEVWYGEYSNYFIIFTDRIRFNKYFMKELSSNEKYNIGVHELGHALGLRHHSISGNVMDEDTFEKYLGTHDIADYNQKWN